MREPIPAPPQGFRRIVTPAERAAGRTPGRGAARAAVLLLTALVAATAAGQRAEDGSGLEVRTLVETVTPGPDGAGALPAALSPETVPQPGVALVYTVRFRNSGKGPVDGVRITKPVPPEVRYVAGSASGPGCDVLFSVDGGRTFGQPAELSVRGADGALRPAGPEDYTHIRWRLLTPLAAQATGFVRFRALAR